MTTQIAKDNLIKDKNVQGKDWLLTYGNYFSDEENIQMFIDAVKPFLDDREIDILYVGSASGLLGEKLITSLGSGQLTLVDISQKHLDDNTNPKTIKVCADLLELNLGKKFDLIIMRSSLDYFPTRALQVQALKIIKKHLLPNGLFINQPAYIPVLDERDLVSDIYNRTSKIGDRFFQSVDLEEIYLDAGFQVSQKIGEGKIMNLTERDHIQRYELTAEEVKTIQDMISEKEGSQYVAVTDGGYSLKFEFPIFLSRCIL